MIRNGGKKRNPSYQKPKVRRYSTRNSSGLLDAKPTNSKVFFSFEKPFHVYLKVTINTEPEVFGTKLAHYGLKPLSSSEPTIPDILPVEKSYDTIKKIPLPSSRGKTH